MMYIQGQLIARTCEEHEIAWDDIDSGAVNESCKFDRSHGPCPLQPYSHSPPMAIVQNHCVP
jgi:hypothetical protein